MRHQHFLDDFVFEFFPGAKRLYSSMASRASDMRIVRVHRAASRCFFAPASVSIRKNPYLPSPRFFDLSYFF